MPTISHLHARKGPPCPPAGAAPFPTGAPPAGSSGGTAEAPPLPTPPTTANEERCSATPNAPAAAQCEARLRCRRSTLCTRDGSHCSQARRPPPLDFCLEISVSSCEPLGRVGRAAVHAPPCVSQPRTFLTQTPLEGAHPQQPAASRARVPHGHSPACCCAPHQQPCGGASPPARPRAFGAAHVSVPLQIPPPWIASLLASSTPQPQTAATHAPCAAAARAPAGRAPGCNLPTRQCTRAFFFLQPSTP